MTNLKNNLVNYQTSNCNSSNYLNNFTSSSPESFPNIMENGILVNYELVPIIDNSKTEPIKNENDVKED